MIVPQFWAEGRIQERVAGKQVTVRRHGWSDESPIAAQAHADQRTREAFDRIAAGEKLNRRERKMAYNGADGMPIREEILERQGEDVVTRNSYGAHCLNTPDVLFVDIDFEDSVRRNLLLTVIVAALIGGGVAGYATRTWIAAVVAGLAVLAVGFWRMRVEGLRVAAERDAGSPEQQARAKLERFIAQRPDWHLRLYRTPAGFRVLAMHDVFSAADTAVADCFQALGVDKIYARMCRHQNCFRARLSAKPWRAGIGDSMRPQPGVWPVAPDKLPLRDAWIARYERAAERFAACRFVESLGKTEQVHPRAQAVQALHDERTRAHIQLPLA